MAREWQEWLGRQGKTNGPPLRHASGNSEGNELASSQGSDDKGRGKQIGLQGTQGWWQRREMDGSPHRN